jgi:pSer/pThr/pTyr-binding forkhead associated (FHA) protein
MRTLAILRCVAKAALKHGANLVGFGLGDVVDDVWNEWNIANDEAARTAELRELVQMAAVDFRKEVEAIVCEVAGRQPAHVQRHLSHCLEQIPAMLRESFRRPEDRQGRSVPPGLRVRRAMDLAQLLSADPTASPAADEPRVILEFTLGARAGEAIVCVEPTVLVFGRAPDCNPQFPMEGHEYVSRHHCLVEINPPDARIRELGSLHGTYVNGMLLPGKRPPGTPPGPNHGFAEVDVADGATVHLTTRGQVAFQVRIVTSRKHAEPADGQDEVKRCAWCHRQVAAERGANRPGMFVCRDCRTNLQAIMHDLAGNAQQGAADLQAIRGYRLLEELGHGGMGAVYLARHEQTGQAAAIKLMLPRVAANAPAVAMFQREVRNTMALDHRHVVRLLDHGYARGAFFLVLEYCEGGSVDQLMAQRGGTLPVDEAVEIALQALEGLEYTHQAPIPFVKQKDGTYAPGIGLVHRDLKPANLFLTGWGSSRLVKLGDYGLAKAFDETGLSGGTRTGETAGTWQFMCRPQVIDCKHAGPEVDVWAVAASLYYMLTGHTPRDFRDDQDPWLAVLENDAVPICKRNPCVPPRLAKVIDTALQEEPRIPFQSADALKDSLEAAI